jgi:hypothetical protein
MKAIGTYLYCLVAAARAPSLERVARGVPGTGRVRLVPFETSAPAQFRKRWLVVADAPLDRFGEENINRRLRDLDWVARAAVAHEAVVESFVTAPAQLPMKLFTIFTSDERAVAHLLSRREYIDATLERVALHDEWGVRVVLHGAPARASANRGRSSQSGAGYLVRKKALRDATAELAVRSRTVVSDLYDRLADLASGDRRRGARELPVKGGPLLLDAAFLVKRTDARRFRSALSSEARRLGREGYGVSLTGPWPPYSFLE